MIFELIKQGITTKLTTKTEKQLKAKFLLTQQGHLLDWITQFDPGNVNSNDLMMPAELKAMADFSTGLVKALPDFLDTTVNHRLKQVAQRNSVRHLSQSIEPTRSPSLSKDLWLKQSGTKLSKKQTRNRENNIYQSYDAG